MKIAKSKVVVVFNIMAPYRFPLFEILSREKDIAVEVFFLSKSAKNRRWNIDSNPELPFKYRILKKIELNIFSKDLFTWIFSPTFPFDITKSKYKVLICSGWLDFACQAGFFISKILRKKYIIWSESTINEPSMQRTLTLPLVKLIVQHSDACIAISTKSEEYLLQLGAKKEKIFKAISTVNVDHFKKNSELSDNEKIEIKKKLKIAASKVILYVGQLIERKGLKYLLQAFSTINKESNDTGLVIVGYGPQKEELERIISTENIKNVTFVDHIEVSVMPKMYGIADLFVLPSTEETFGLVINEAMACSLPVITTDRVGSSLDLIKENENGYVVKAGDSEALYLAIKSIINSPELLQKMGEKSGEIIKQFSPEAQAREFVKAINYVSSK